MTDLTININLLVLAGSVVLVFFAGYLLRSGQLRRERKKIRELEQEMLTNHAEILELEKELAKIKKREISDSGRQQPI